MTKIREEKLVNIMEKMSCVVKNAFKKSITPDDEFNLSTVQIMFLLYINKHPENNNSKTLAKTFSVTSGAVTQTIDSLVEKELISRKEDPDDRRTIRLLLTEKAKEKLERFKKIYAKTACTLFANLEMSEIDDLLKIMDKIKKI